MSRSCATIHGYLLSSSHFLFDLFSLYMYYTLCTETLNTHKTQRFTLWLHYPSMNGRMHEQKQLPKSDFHCAILDLSCGSRWPSVNNRSSCARPLWWALICRIVVCCNWTLNTSFLVRKLCQTHVMLRAVLYTTDCPPYMYNPSGTLIKTLCLNSYF